MPQPLSEKFLVQLTPRQRSEVERVAQQCGVSMSEVLRWALDFAIRAAEHGVRVDDVAPMFQLEWQRGDS